MAISKSTYNLVRLADYSASFISDLRYYSNNNFTNSQVTGYQANEVFVLEPLVAPLVSLMNFLSHSGHKLVFWDAYRPQCAVDYFYQWSLNNDNSRKNEFYPNISKSELFTSGFLSKTSSHTKGVAIDITLAYETDQRLDFGTDFDFFDIQSAHSYLDHTQVVVNNRRFLHSTMRKFGFVSYDKEWWHYRFTGIDHCVLPNLNIIIK